MRSSAEISVVLTLGSPKRLNRSSVTSRMRSAVRRGFFRVAWHGRGILAPAGRQAAYNPAPSSAYNPPSTCRPMPAIRFDHVSKTYTGARGTLRALDACPSTSNPGEFFGLLGPNGAGKTTLISVLAGLTRATSGRVTVMGHDVVNDYAAARKALGIVPQELVFDPFFSVRETLRIQSGYFGVPNNDAWIDELLAELGLADKAAPTCGSCRAA
jgi:ABC-type multidrug transport system fused ATPase/permease subunit